MKAKLIDDERGQKTFAVIFDKGDEFIDKLTSFAMENELGASHFTAIGAFRDVMLGYFDRETKNTKRYRSWSRWKCFRWSAISLSKATSLRSTPMSCSAKRTGRLMEVIFLKPMYGRPWKSC